MSSCSAEEAAVLVCPLAEELQLHLSGKGYDGLELLATGGMGAIYRARQISLDRPVAIKVLTHSCSLSLQFRQLIKTEAKLMAKLNHPNIASIYDYGEVNGMLYIVMRYAEGRTLFDAANGRPIQQAEAAKTIATIARALDYAHGLGILHRDIKPANIIIDHDMEPTIVDFGLAHHSSESTIKGDTVYGTPGYTAPEVIEPPYRADQRADIFSLGALFHELLTGAVPGTPYRAASTMTEVDPRYDIVVMRAINPNPKLRYARASELADDLETILSDKSLSSSALLHDAPAMAVDAYQMLS